MQSPNNDYNATSKRGWFTRFLDGVEWLGNLLPHPITLFAVFCLFIIFISGIAAYFGVSAVDPRDGETVIKAVKSSISRKATFLEISPLPGFGA